MRNANFCYLSFSMSASAEITANKLNHAIVGGSKKLYSLSVGFLQEAGPRFLPASWRIRSEKRDPFEVTILFVPVSVPLEQLAACWSQHSDETLLRRRPVCNP